MVQVFRPSHAFDLTRKEVTMSVVSPHDRLASARNLSAVHSDITFSIGYVVASFRSSFEDVTATRV
ncbi:MAG: hypothetical protein QOC57_791, partial [Ilumatobacteraceae bacterium]